jgi:putative membrane protein
VFGALLWFWHAPGPYAWTFESDLAYWLMHISMIGAAVWFWTTVLAAAENRLGGFVAAMAATAIQMGLLGALITFAPRPLYAPHQLTTLAWGLTPLQDQQLGGVIMWVPAGAIFVFGLVGALGGAMRRGEALALARAVAR